MKALYSFILFISLFTACTKEKHLVEEQKPAKEATIQYMGNPAADGFGWVLSFNDEHFEIPTNLPDQYKTTGVKVKVVYRRSSQLFACRCTEPKFMIDIISIERIN